MNAKTYHAPEGQTISPADSSTARLLGVNAKRNHFRILAAMTVVTALIFGVTTFLELIGRASPAITVPALIRVLLVCSLILFLLWRFIAHYGDREIAKWVVITAVFLEILTMLTAPHDVPESHAVFYLVIVLSVFYFDIKLLFYCLALCVFGDMLLIERYPTMRPDPFEVGLIIRYLTYLWVTLGLAIGSQATKEMIQSATNLATANVRLREDIERKTQMDRMRKDFIASVSHELQTPISLIEGYGESLRDKKVRDEERDYCLDVIVDESKKMGRMVAGMLEISKMESGHVRLERASFYLDSLAAHVTRLYGQRIEEKGLRLELDAPADQVRVEADPGQIDQVMTNFLSNAVRHSPTGSRLTVQVRDLGPEGALFAVENEGDTLEPADLERIWEAFYRTDRARSRKLGGTGLGLAIARTILIQHNARFGAENTPTGVRFFFILPAANE
ncbi:MAG: sensor histidine kinase [Solirubrobacterales bacterium]